MKTRSTIQILFIAILFIAAALSTAYSQEPLPPDKKRALHRFDPADIFPEDRESTRGAAGRRRPRREAPAASAAPRNQAPPSNRLRSLTPAPTPRVSTAKAKPSPAPTTTPSPQVAEATPTSTPAESAATPQVEATPQFDAMAAVQSSGISPQVPGGDQVGSGDGFPLYFLLPLLGLIIFVLIALIVSLKKQLRTP
jgi:hypothetical protein